MIRALMLWMVALMMPLGMWAQHVPTPVSETERTIEDLLYSPYACMTDEVNSAEKAKEQLTVMFGGWEAVNNIYVGMHRSDSFDFSYAGEPIVLNYVDWFDNRHWYHFYFDTMAKANAFSALITKDIIKAGIPLTKDNVYGGMSNRKRPVKIFKWVFVSPVQKVKEADGANIHREDVVGKYCVEVGVYKRKAPKTRVSGQRP